jgi:hypothetical protein
MQQRGEAIMATKQQVERLTGDCAQDTYNEDYQDIDNQDSQDQQEYQDIKKPIDPPGLTWTSLWNKESSPYAYDPNDKTESDIGTAVVLHLHSDYASIPDDDINTFLNHISYDQLTGSDDIIPEKHGLVLQNKPSIAKLFDSRAYAMATWH